LFILFIIFSVAAFIQLLYFIFFLSATYQRDLEPAAAPQPVSILVCAHDEEENLKELIPLLLNQQYGAPFEIIIVNDRSNDGTYDLLLELTKAHNNLRMVNIVAKPDHVNSKKYAITLGIKAAKHEWILLTDADCRPASLQWIHRMSSKFNPAREIVVGYSPYNKEPGFLNLFIRFETLFTAIQYITFAWLGNPYMGVGRNLAYRKTLFLKNKGFDDFSATTGGDDDLFVNRHATQKNTAVMVGTDALVYSIPKKTWKSFFEQKVRHLAAGKRYKFSHKVLLGAFALTQALTWFMGIALLFSAKWFPWVSAALILRTFVFSAVVHETSGRFGHKFESWTVPLLDFLFVIYYLSTAPVALLTKKLQWKN